MRQALRCTLIALLVLVPLAITGGSSKPTQIKDLLFVAGITACTAGWVALSRHRRTLSITLSPMAGVLSLNVLIWVVTLLRSPFPGEGIPVLASRLAGVGLLLLMPLILTRARDLRWALALLLVTAGLMSCYSLLQFFRIDPLFDTGGLEGHFRVSSTTDHPNIFVSFLVACVPLNLAAFGYLAPSKRGRILLSLSLILCLAAATATMSRAGWAAMVIALVTFSTGLLLWRRGKRSSIRPAIFGVVLIIVVLVGGILTLAATPGVLDGGERERVFSLSGHTVEKRALIYQAALRMSASSPVWGKGLGTFRIFLPEYRDAELARFFPRNEYRVEHAVSEPLEVLAESGAVGLLAWLLMVAVFIAVPLRGIRRTADPGGRRVLLAIVAGLLGLVAHGALEVSLRYQPPLLMFWALPGLALALLGGEREQHRRVVLPAMPWRLLAHGALGLVLCAALAWTLAESLANRYLKKAHHALHRGTFAAAADDLRVARRVQPFNLQAWYLSAYCSWSLGLADQAEAQYLAVIRRDPYYYDVNQNLARILFRQGKVRQAIPWVERAMRMNPYHRPSQALAVRVYLGTGALRRAERIALQLQRDAGSGAQAALALARVRLAQERVEEARVILTRARVHEPDNQEIQNLLVGTRVKHETF